MNSQPRTLKPGPNAEPRTVNRRGSETGVALVVTLLLTSLLTALGLALMLLSIGETWLSAAFRTSEALSYAADAAVARVQIDLSRSADWTVLLSGGGPVSSFDDGAVRAMLSDASAIDLDAETRAVQARSDARHGSGNPDRPMWRLFAHGPLPLLAADTSVPPIYLVAWIADDEEDGDADPLTDVNGRVSVHAEAFAPGGARRSAEALFGRAPAPGPSGAPSAVRLLVWRELR